MSGIFIVFDNNTNAKKNFKYLESAKLLEHRGNQELIMKKFEIGQLFFYRLKTEESQVQPYFDNDLIIVIDGEVYNSDQLAKELYPQHYSTKNINLLICKLYKKYGEKFISKINGMFSLVIIDLNKKKVFACKDKLGLKPLFYYNKNNVFIISSEAKSIINLTDDTKINYQNSLASIFMCGRPPYGKTHFDNIYDVEQSRLLTFDYKDNKIKLIKYFDLEDWISEKKYFNNKKLKDNDYLEIFYDLFNKVVERQLIGTSKFGNLFSAGLDSSFIALLMSQKLNSKINLYYFESEINNYEKYYKNFISGDKFNLNKLKQDDRNYVIDIPLMVYHYECTAKEEASPIALLADRARKNNDLVLLTGDGDTILGGSRCHASYFSRSFLYENFISKNMIKLFNRLFNDVFNAGIGPDKIDYLYFPAFFSSSEVFTNVLLHNAERLEEWNKRLSLYSFVENKTERETQAFIIDDVFYRFQRYMIRQERSSSRYGVQFRLPFLDDEIIKLSVNMPLHLKQKFNLFQPNERFGMITEGKSIIRKIAIKAGLDKKIVYRAETGSQFNGIHYKTIIEKFGLKNLSNFLNINENNLKDVAINSHDANLTRLQYSFIANEILLRIFDKKESPTEISNQFKEILFSN